MKFIFNIKYSLTNYVENNYGLLYIPLIPWFLILDAEGCIFLSSLLLIHSYLGVINLLKDYIHNLYVWKISIFIANISFIFLFKSLLFFVV